MRDARFDDQGWNAQSPPSPEEIALACGKGQALGLTIPERDTIAHAYDELAHKYGTIQDSFFKGLSESVLADEARKRIWVSFLDNEARQSAKDPSRIILGSDARQAKGLENLARAWAEQRHPFEVWDSQRWEGIVYDGRYPFRYLRLLLTLEPRAWCEAIDALSSPGMMGMALELAQVAEDRELIESILRAAPPVFEDGGRWAPSRSVAALLLTKEIVSHARRLEQAVNSRIRSVEMKEGNVSEQEKLELAHIRSEELPAWMGRAFNLVLSRADGKHIAVAFLGHLARKEPIHEHRAGSDTWSAERVAFRVLAKTLNERRVSVQDVRDVWRVHEAIAQEKREQEELRRPVRRKDSGTIDANKGEGARTLYGEGLLMLRGAAVMLDEPSTSLAEIEAFWSWFEELLVRRDPGLPLAESSAEAQQLFGLLLSRLPDPEQRFRRTYIALEPQRRRALHEYKYKEHDNDRSSTLLLHVGLYAAENRSRQQGEKSDPSLVREWFWWIYAAARRLWLTVEHDLRETKRDLVSACFAFMPLLFRDDLEMALRRAIVYVANDSLIVCTAACLLWRNGVEIGRLEPLLQGVGVNIGRALRDAYQWAKLTDSGAKYRHYGERRREFPQGLEDLADALGLSLETEPPEEASSPQSDRARCRDELVRCIPWGAAFFTRLEMDGCTPTRIVPLEAKGTTWLVQIALPVALRDRFGLSAEARILVVHGQVHGRDLRALSEDPGGAANVDPDCFVIVSDQPGLEARLPMLGGPWGQRLPWAPLDGAFEPLADAMRDHLPDFDLFEYRDPVKRSALVGRRSEIDDLIAHLSRGEAVGVVGLRKVGKSSLVRSAMDVLDPIGARAGRFEAMSAPPEDIDTNVLVVPFDVQSVAGRPVAVLLERLNERLLDRLNLAGVQEDTATNEKQLTTESLTRTQRDAAAGDPMEELRYLLNLALSHTKRTLCFVLDEYDLLFVGYDGGVGIPGAENLLRLLREYAQITGRVSLALIGRDPVFLAEPLLSGQTNPLAGWAKPMFLGSLRRDEADELMNRFGKRVGLEVGPGTRETAWEWTGGHPLLLRQYGAAVYELAHAPPTRPRPVPTDPVCKDAVLLFVRRDAVETICSEVRSLLDARFPEALALLEAIADAPKETLRAVVSTHGGSKGRAFLILARFGILSGGTEAPFVPDVFRNEFTNLEPIADRLAARLG